MDETPLFREVRGGWGSRLMMPWSSCKLKTKKGHYLLAIFALHQLDYISLFITTYVACYIHCSFNGSKNIMTALLEYLNLDCSIIVFQIIDAIELSSPSQLQIILGGKTP